MGTGSDEMKTRYRIVKKFCTTASSELFEGVFEGRGNFQRRVMLKRPLPHIRENEDALRSFLDEVRVLSKLRHGQVVGILDVLERDDDGLFVVMEYVDGVTLSDMMARAKRAELLCPEEVVLTIAIEVLRALVYIHSARDDDGSWLGVVHRDLKPSNIVVSKTGDVSIIDFGNAWVYERSHQTDVGIAMGCLDYMSPEQLSGGLVDARSDLFSVACVVHEMLVGVSPVVPEHTGKFRVNSSVCPDVAHVLRRSLREAREERFQSAQEMLSALWPLLVKRSTLVPQLSLIAWLQSVGCLSGQPDALPSQALLSPRGAPPLGTVALPKDRTQIVDPFAKHENEARIRVPSTSGVNEKRLLRDSRREGGPSLVGKKIGHIQLKACIRENTFWAYRAVDGDTGEPLRVQVHPGGAFSSREERLRISDQAQASARIMHRYIVPLRDHGNMGPYQYFVQAELGGDALDRVIAREAPFPYQRIVHLARQLFSIVAAFHASGLVHGSLCPWIFGLVPEDMGETLLMHAFDLERVLDGSTFIESGFAAPEVRRGEKPTQKSDLYSAAAILYAMLTKEAPDVFLGVHAGPRALQDLFPLLSKALAPVPEQRLGSASQLLNFFRNLPLSRSEATTQRDV